ncbi:hypothetical protein BC830DRAFT_396971 [Chytriomyces sp. MP71]|nr:hypothetical protein BC830DRAFT_396971 [Chytriomyces sp. MP71]
MGVGSGWVAKKSKNIDATRALPNWKTQRCDTEWPPRQATIGYPRTLFYFPSQPTVSLPMNHLSWTQMRSIIYINMEIDHYSYVISSSTGYSSNQAFHSWCFDTNFNAVQHYTTTDAITYSRSCKKIAVAARHSKKGFESTQCRWRIFCKVLSKFDGQCNQDV